MCLFIWPETCLYGHYNEMYFLPTVKGYAYRTVSFSLLTFKAPVLCRSITFSIRWQLMNAVNPKAQFLGEFRESFPLKREVVWIKCRSWIQLARTRHRLVFRIRNIELTRRRKKIVMRMRNSKYEMAAIAIRDNLNWYETIVYFKHPRRHST